MAEKALKRQDWIDACRFHDMTEKEVLAEVARRVSHRANSLVLLDLDSTLYEVGPRTLQILKEWASKSTSEFSDVKKTVTERMTLQHIGYSVRDSFHAAGITVDDSEQAFESAKKFWSSRFFSNDYLKYDVAYPGASRFTQRLFELGANLIYLTGRDEPGMGIGTRENLVRDGFPWAEGGDRTRLLLKKSTHLADLDHKVEAANSIKAMGNLVASFENEPKNLVALYEVLPDAMHVFVDTIYSDHEAVACEGLYRIKGFSAG